MVSSPPYAHICIDFRLWVICQDPDESQTVRKDTPHINHRLPRGIAKPGSRGRRWPAARHLQSAAPSGVRGVPNRDSTSSISSPDAIAGCRRPSPYPDPKASKSRFFEGPFFGPFFGPPFSVLGRFSKRTKTSQSPPLALLGGVLGRLRLAVSAENSIIPCLESTCASGVFWASEASPGSHQVPVLNPRAPFLGP